MCNYTALYERKIYHYKKSNILTINANKMKRSVQTLFSAGKGPQSRSLSGAQAAAVKTRTAPTESKKEIGSFDVRNHLPIGPVVKNNDITIHKGEGLWVWDKDGNKYLDMTAGIGVLSTGHCHPHVVKTLQDQIATMMHAQQAMFMSHTAQDAFIERFLKHVPSSHDQFVFTSCGTAATENAVKVARMATGKSNVISLHRGFHGRLFGSMSWSSSKTNYRQGFQPMMPGAFFVPEPTAESFDSVLEHQTAPTETCAVILEPVQGEGGIWQIPLDFLRHVRRKCDEHGICLIYDEVQSGVGRCGKYWGYQAVLDEHNTGESDIEPDVICFAKGIASGFPFGGISASHKFYDRMTKNALGSTYGGSAMGMAAASATMDVFENEGILENTNKMGALIAEEMRRMPLVKEVRQHGLLIGADIDTNWMVGQAVKKASEEHGLILHTCGKNSLRIIPSLTIKSEEVSIFSERIYRILKEMENEGVPGKEASAMTM